MTKEKNDFSRTYVFTEFKGDAKVFITLEGIDGAGKTTQARILEELLGKVAEGRPILRTREPGGWEGGEALRQLIIKEHFRHPWTEVLLFIADRCEHAKRVILPALKRNEIVLCERYNDSTLAYQVWGRGLSRDGIRQVILSTDLPEPDLTFWLDLDVETAIRRISKRGKPDRIESDRKLLSRISAGYRALWEKEPQRIRRIDAGGTPEDTAKKIENELRCHMSASIAREGSNGSRAGKS
jgi:dTMP kinase